MDAESRQRQIQDHLEAIRALERQEEQERRAEGWPPSGFYTLWHVVFGIVLGGLGAMVSLIANVVGAPLFGRRPLDLIRVYLTFPMGERALTMDSGLVLTAGCLLYLVTGALFGVLLHLVLRRLLAEGSPQADGWPSAPSPAWCSGCSTTT